MDPENPWVGLASYTEETRASFEGRNEEIAELARRVLRKSITVLFGQSGLGKTSLLRAGLVPRLRDEGFCPVYLRVDYSPESPPPSEQIKQAIFRAADAGGHWTRPGTAIEGESLWEFLHHRGDLLRDARGRTLQPLLIFDQFEEIFTLAQTNTTGQLRAKEFLEELADLIENRPPTALVERLENDEAAAADFDFAHAGYRILIALREDYLANLEGMKDIMPSITQNRMRLARMTGAQALTAVVKPGGRLVSQEVAESIVRFVAGGAELADAEVEPSLLSLICRELNTVRQAQGHAEISADLLAGSRDTILSEFYERALADQPAGVRRMIEDELLTDSGFRESWAEARVVKAMAAAGAAPDALTRLVDRRLLRIEERLDSRRVELTHDVLCGVVKASRELRVEREAAEEAERRIAVQKARAEAARKALVRTRQIAAGCALLALIAIAASIFGYVSMQHAQSTRQMAETARGESERLIVYLFDDFSRELEPLGRLEIVAGLARHVLEYYEGLPEELRTPETDRNRAMALARYGSVLVSQGNLNEAKLALDDSIQTLDRLRQGGDASEPTAVGLAMGLRARARALHAGGSSTDSLAPAAQAVDVIKPVATAAGSSVAARRTYGTVLTYLGFLQLRQNQTESAAASLAAARDALSSLDELSLVDLNAAAKYAETSAWLVETFTELGRLDDAKRVGEEGRSVASRLLELHPTHLQALSARALLADSLADIETNELDAASGLALLNEATHDWALLTQIDPSDVISWSNLGASRLAAAEVLLSLGRPRAAIARLGELQSIEAEAESSWMVAGVLNGNRARMALLTGEIGDIRRSENLRRESLGHFEVATRDLSAESFELPYWRLDSLVGDIDIALSQGNYRRARSIADGLRARIEQLAPPDDYAKQQKTELLRHFHYGQARADLRLNDLAGAEQNALAVVRYREQLPAQSMRERRAAAADSTVAAIVLARLGQQAEAQQLIRPVMDFHRGLAAMQHDNQTVKLEFIEALYASALANPARSAALLDEAQSLFSTLSPEMRALRSAAYLRARIAEARR
jgi:hypothetical protein